MRDVAAVYVDTIDVTGPDGVKRMLDIWQNPETKELVGLSTMELPSERNFVFDPYQDGVRLTFANTFSGLPK